MTVPMNMNRWILNSVLVLTAIAGFAVGEASAQVVVVGPSITFTHVPRLVVVSPGIQVVENHDREIFYLAGYYWTRTDGHWYRTSNHRGRWVPVHSAHVPRTLVRIKPGTYRRHHGSHVVKRHHTPKRQHVVVAKRDDDRG